MNYIWIIAAAIFGVLVGVIFTTFIKSKRISYGTLLINLTDPENDTFKLILDEDLESLVDYKQVRLQVIVKTNSQQ